jgi:hypothetical protein
LRRVGAYGRGVPQEVVELLQQVPPQLASMAQGGLEGEEGAQVSDEIKGLIQDGAGASSEASATLQEFDLGQLGKANERQDSAIALWKEALEKWEDPPSDDESENEENSEKEESEPDSEVAEREQISEEVLNLYQQMEQDDAPFERAEGTVREGIRPW